MRRSQRSSQSSLPKLQTYQGFYEQKPQKPRLEILGSLIFVAGLTLSKPACAVSKVSSAALSVSPTNQQGGEVVTSAGIDTAAIPSHLEPLPQVEEGEAIPIWSQPTQGSVDAAVQKTSIQEIAKEKREDGETGRRGDGETGRRGDGEIETNPIQGGQSSGLGVKPSVDSPFSTFCLSSPPARVPDTIESSSAISSVTGQPSVLSPELKALCNLQISNRDEWQGHEEVGTRVHPKVAERVLIRDKEDKGDKGDSTETKKDIYTNGMLPGTQESQQETIPQNLLPKVLTAQAGNASPSELQPPGSPNSSETQQPSKGQDPELGNLRLRELAAPPPPSQPSVYLLGGVGYFRSNNIFSGVDPVDDGLFRTGLTLLAVPALGPKTSLLASVGGNITRYSERSLYDYNELNFNLGIRQRLGSRAYGELGWNNRQLFSRDSGDRFLDDHSVYLELGRRDSLTNQLSLDTFYQARLSFANPSNRSQVINYLGASLNYAPSPSLEVALDYQFAIADFTKQDRLDLYHQLIARLSYTLSRNSRFYLFGGHSFGHSSDSSINFDGLVFGAGVDFNLSLF